MADKDAKEPEQHRARETRAGLVAAVERLAARLNGESLPSSSEIAAEAGVAVGTLYRYFKNADDLMLEAFDDAHERVNGCWFQGLPELKGKSSRVRAKAFLKTYRVCAEQEPAYVHLLKLARQIRSVSEEMALNVDTPESHQAFAALFDIKPTPTNLSTIRLLKFTTQQLMNVYFVADEADRVAIGKEIEAYTEQALDRLGG
ncbi:MAG: TetR/AcrR family transcriptional regulator [Pseudomonadota bacterium]